MVRKKFIPIFFIMVILLGGEFVIVGGQANAGCCACGYCSRSCTCPGTGGCGCAAPTSGEDPMVKEKIKGEGESFVASTDTLTERFAASVRGAGGKFGFKVQDTGEKAMKFGCPESDDKTNLHGNIVFALADTGDK